MKIHKSQKVEGCCADTAGRYAMNYALLKCGQPDDKGERKGELIATNGRVLVVATVECDAADVDGYVTVEALAAARRHATARVPAVLECSGSLKVTARGVTTTLERPGAEAGEFPRYAAVVPPKIEGVPTLRVSINAKLLADIAAGISSEEHMGAVTLTIDLGEQARNKSGQYVAAIRVEGARGYGAIMPITIDT